MSLDRFNFDTMSGVYPGTRTQIFQRVLLQRAFPAAPAAAVPAATDPAATDPAATDPAATDPAATVPAATNPAAPAAPPQRTWALIYWYEEPAACVVRIEGEVTPLRFEIPTVHTPLVQTPLVQTPPTSDRATLLHRALLQHGWEPFVCGTCLHWQAGAGTSVDGLPLGKCTLTRTHESIDIPLLLGAQSTLALGCPHWTRTDSAHAGEAPRDSQPAEQAQPEQAQPEQAQPEQAHPHHLLPMHPLPKIAEISESKMKPLRRWQVRVRRWLSPPPAAPTLHDHLVERSGVGAGTEPCPCCQGRIANLGALAVQDDATDKQTLSVWRCRVCHALFLSDWVDRWERVDSLETEETLYRIAPIEAAEMLTLIASVQEAEHPRRRRERSAEREWVLAQVAGREPVSHVIKQGR